MINTKFFALFILLGSFLGAVFAGNVVLTLVPPQIGDIVFTISAIAGFMTPNIAYVISITKMKEVRLNKESRIKVSALVTVVIVLLLSIFISILLGWLMNIYGQKFFSEDAAKYYCIEGGVIGFMILKNPAQIAPPFQFSGTVIPEKWYRDS